MYLLLNIEVYILKLQHRSFWSSNLLREQKVTVAISCDTKPVSHVQNWTKIMGNSENSESECKCKRRGEVRIQKICRKLKFTNSKENAWTIPHLQIKYIYNNFKLCPHFHNYIFNNIYVPAGVIKWSVNWVHCNKMSCYKGKHFVSVPWDISWCHLSHYSPS